MMFETTRRDVQKRLRVKLQHKAKKL